MNVYHIAPDACVMLLFTLVIAVYIESYLLCVVIGVVFIVLVYYVRGSYQLAGLDVNQVACPCDGVIEELYGEKRKYTYIKIRHAVHHQHGFYALVHGEVTKLVVEGTQLYMELLSSSGVLTIQNDSLHIAPRVFVRQGDVVEQGQLLYFLPSSAVIELKVPMCETDVNVHKDSDIRSGQVLGRIQQVWI
jgi:hypothetical protein